MRTQGWEARRRLEDSVWSGLMSNTKPFPIVVSTGRAHNTGFIPKTYKILIIQLIKFIIVLLSFAWMGIYLLYVFVGSEVILIINMRLSLLYMYVYTSRIYKGGERKERKGKERKGKGKRKTIKVGYSMVVTLRVMKRMWLKKRIETKNNTITQRKPAIITVISMLNQKKLN